MQGTSTATSGLLHSAAGLGFIGGMLLTDACTPHNLGDTGPVLQSSAGFIQQSSKIIGYVSVTFPHKREEAVRHKDGLRTQTPTTGVMTV